jgi:hypothetical protein
MWYVKGLFPQPALVKWNLNHNYQYQNQVQDYRLFTFQLMITTK